MFSLSHFLHNLLSNSVFSAEQQTVVYLFSLVKQSVDANSPSHSHALRLDEIPESLHWNSSLPYTDSHFFALFYVYMRTTSLCFQLPQGDIVVITTSREFTNYL